MVAAWPTQLCRHRQFDIAYGAAPCAAYEDGSWPITCDVIVRARGVLHRWAPMHRETLLMTALRLFLFAYAVGLAVYTAVVIADHGWDLFSIFFGDIVAVTWAGQFNADFTGFLILSALWTAWRNRFSATGIALASIALLGGILFLAIYLLWLSRKAESIGDLLGQPDVR